MAGGAYRLEVTGLKEARRALRDIDPQLSREITVAHRAVSSMVASDAQAAAQSLGGVHAHAADAIRARAAQTYAGIAVGNNAHPEALGAEFGGGSRPRTRQFPPWRGNGENAGYAVYPTIRRLIAGGQVDAAYLLAVDVVLGRLFGGEADTFRGLVGRAVSRG
jgi:hypothetical protein